MIVYVVICNGWDLTRESYNDICSVHRTIEKAEEKRTELSMKAEKEQEYTIEEHELEE